ncbi:MAG: hypothetical protein EXR43_01840 [Dehalococcoidia bacterium]|nr:hypothetical protein [Dehalococcoidia bacterium]
MSVRIKICGVRTIEAARAAADAGADFIGMVLTQSRRRAGPEMARAIVAELGERPAMMSVIPPSGAEWFELALTARRPLVVGVFGEEAGEEIAQAARSIGLDAIQLSGRSALAQAVALDGWPLIVAVRPDEGDDPDALPLTMLPLLEASHATKLGGTGERVDAAAAARYAAARPSMLAGGLTAEDVAEAIAAVRPWGVDVSGGVETDGAKDHEKIRAFVAAVRQADRPLGLSVQVKATGQRDRPEGLSLQGGERTVDRTDRPSGLSFNPRRSSPRLSNFDYLGPYVYSLTISTAARDDFRMASFVDDCTQLLGTISAKHGFDVLAYCFMPSHLHLLVKGSDGSSLPAFMKQFKQGTGYRFRRRFGRPLWQRSYYDHVLRRDEDIRVAADYIWNNPVNAGLTSTREQYPFMGPPERLGQA